MVLPRHSARSHRATCPLSHRPTRHLHVTATARSRHGLFHHISGGRVATLTSRLHPGTLPEPAQPTKTAGFFACVLSFAVGTATPVSPHCQEGTGARLFSRTPMSYPPAPQSSMSRQLTAAFWHSRSSTDMHMVFSGATANASSLSFRIENY